MHTAARSTLPVFIAWTCIGVASLCLLGWVGDIALLTSVFAGFPRMVPMTAILTMLAGAALRLCQHGQAGGQVGGRAGLPAVLLAAASGAILLAYGAAALGLPLGQPIQRSGMAGLSSPVTAVMFLGIGLSLLALPHARLVKHAQWCALGVLLVALLTLAGFLFRETLLYQLLPGSGTSLLTVSVLALLATGCLASRPLDGMMAAVAGDTLGARVARRLLLSAVMFPIMTGVLVWAGLHLDVIDIETAIALLVWGITACFVVVTWQAALRLSHAYSARLHAEEALRRADANKDRFLAVLAHELRNPLAPVRAVADLLRLPAGIDGAQQRKAGEILARQAEHMTHLIEDLLDMSRVRQGLLTIEHAPVDLLVVAGDAQDQTRPLMAQRRHRLQATLPEGPLRVSGDHRRLVQVVVNLLVNAAKYTPEGGEITLALHATPEQAVIAVCDNGNGIEAAMLERVFDSFTQETRTTERGGGGLGIGLALVRNLVELHAGSVNAHSDGKGKGSRFVVTLPRLYEV